MKQPLRTWFKRVFWSLLGILVLAVAAGGIYAYSFEYAVQEETPPAVALAERLIAALREETPTNGGPFFYGDADAAMLQKLRPLLADTLRSPGKTDISAGVVFSRNTWKPDWSAMPYTVRVFCAHTNENGTRSFWLEYQPARERFIARVWLGNGADMLIEVPSAMVRENEAP